MVPGLIYVYWQRSRLKDWGIQVRVTGYNDAAAGLATGSRHGLRKVAPTDTVFLWAQQVVIEAKAKLSRNDLCLQSRSLSYLETSAAEGYYFERTATSPKKHRRLGWRCGNSEVS